MYTNHTNPIALANQEHLCRALLQLMLQKPFERISITELCRAAGLERITFYRHFDGKEDVVRYYLDRQMTHLLSSLPHQSTLQRNLIILYEWIFNEREALHALMDNHMTYALSHALNQSVLSLLTTNISDEERRALPSSDYAVDDPYIESAVVGTLMGLAAAWRTDGYRRTPQELALYTMSLFGLQDAH